RAIGDRDLDHVIALYEGEVAWVDAHVGAIMHALEASGLAEKTLVIVVSDHGEEFFDHGNIGHRHTLYEEAVRVPMLLRLPRVLPGGAAAHGPVSLTDLLPTVLDILGLSPAPTRGAPGDGHSMRFPDPSVRAALAAFRGEDTELATLRRRHTSPLPLNVRLKLESVGYVDRASGPAFPEPDVLLPPPREG